MSFRLELTLENKGPTPHTTIIPKGTVFEVMDPESGIQNLVSTREVTVTLDAGQTHRVQIETWCMNAHYASPSFTPMQLTPFVAGQDYPSQDRVWSDLNTRR